MKTVGILGGMGTQATIFFMNKIVQYCYGVSKDTEYPHMVVDNYPQIPSRTRAILYKEESPIIEMVGACSKLENYPVDFIAIPCNSACYWIDMIQNNVCVPVLDIIEITSRAVTGNRVIPLSGYVPYHFDLYEKYLGDKYVKLDEDDQSIVYSLIEYIKIHGYDDLVWDEYMKFQCDIMERYNADQIVSACTELSMYGADVSSVDELAKQVVRIVYE
jgi:aspartate racemase